MATVAVLTVCECLSRGCESLYQWSSVSESEKESRGPSFFISKSTKLDLNRLGEAEYINIEL